jgi:hypothetical protein
MQCAAQGVARRGKACVAGVVVGLALTVSVCYREGLVVSPKSARAVPLNEAESVSELAQLDQRHKLRMQRILVECGCNGSGVECVCVCVCEHAHTTAHRHMHVHCTGRGEPPIEGRG